MIQATRFSNQLMELKLWYLSTWLETHPTERFMDALRARTGLDRHLPPDILPALEALYRDSWRSASADFVHRAMEFLRPHLVIPSPISGPCLTIGDELDEPHHAAILHVCNQRSAESPFLDRNGMRSQLLELADQAETKLNATAIATWSWLNSYPRWLDLVPKAWRQRLSPADDDITWSEAVWGQFMNARGEFNHKHAAQFRQTSQLPYPARGSWCTLTELREHLRGHKKTAS